MVNRIAEGHLAAELRDVLTTLMVGDTLPDSERWREAQVSLEFWWPSIYHWDEESLDGFDFLEAVKSAPRQVRLRGLALLITDQVWTPCAAEIGIDQQGRRIETYRLQLGQAGAGDLGLDRSARYRSSGATALRAQLVADPLRAGWVFDVSHSESDRPA